MLFSVWFENMLLAFCVILSGNYILISRKLTIAQKIRSFACIIIHQKENLKCYTESLIKILSKSAGGAEGWAWCVTHPLKDADGVCLNVDPCPLDYGDT